MAASNGQSVVDRVSTSSLMNPECFVFLALTQLPRASYGIERLKRGLLRSRPQACQTVSRNYRKTRRKASESYTRYS